MCKASPDPRAARGQRADRIRKAIIAQIVALAAIGPIAVGAAGGADAGHAYGGLQPVARGVYVQRGADEVPTTANAGAIGNLGVLVGPSGAIVINTGSSGAHAAALLDAVAQVTAVPVVLAINTQASPDQVLGNAEFTRRGIPVLAHRDTDRFMRERCDACIAAVKSEADNGALDATHVAWPTRLIDGSQTITAGGRTIELVYLGWTKQPGCVAVFDSASRVLFTGDVASFGVVPQVQQAHLPTWIDALDRLRAMHPSRVVPAHGPPGPAAQLEQVRAYLQQLLDGTRAAYARGDGLMDAVARLDLPDYRSWRLYDAYQRRNVHFTYLQIEQQDLGTGGDR